MERVRPAGTQNEQAGQVGDLTYGTGDSASGGRHAQSCRPGGHHFTGSIFPAVTPAAAAWRAFACWPSRSKNRYTTGVVNSVSA